MTASSIYLVLLALNGISKAQCDGQFFQINKDDIPMKMEEPFLSADVFDCQREKSCTTLIRNSKEKRGADSKNAILSISKTTDPSSKYPTCAMGIRENRNEEGYYKLYRGNMLHPIDVECKVINETTYEIIHHDSEKTEMINGYEAPGSFRRQIKYDISLEDVKLFVDSAASCSQFAKFDCYSSSINEYWKIYSYFVDRNYIPISYIGERPTNGRGCQCSAKKQCAQSGLLCNCDMNDDVWRTDSGLFAEKFRLPLTEVRVGDTGSSDEMVRYTIGPLRCCSGV